MNTTALIIAGLIIWFLFFVFILAFNYCASPRRDRKRAKPAPHTETQRTQSQQPG